MKIVKIGDFDRNGNPVTWFVDCQDLPEKGYCLGIDTLFPGSVDVNGVEIVEWTALRCKRMAEG